MSPNSDMSTNQGLEEKVWKALSDSTRRKLLDSLKDQERTTGELCKEFEPLSRTAVMKHLDLLEAATLITVRREGRLRWNQINPAPIQQICERWISPHLQVLTHSMLKLKQHVEDNGKPKP